MFILLLPLIQEGLLLVKSEIICIECWLNNRLDMTIAVDLGVKLQTNRRYVVDKSLALYPGVTSLIPSFSNLSDETI